MGSWYTNNEAGKALLVFEEKDESKELDTVTLSMLINNNISCLVPCSISQIDDDRYIKFNITSKIEFTEFLERQTTFDVVSDLFINMCRSFIELHKYMIDISALQLSPERMYIDMSTRMAQFVMIPLIEEQRPVDSRHFFQSIVVQLKMSPADSRYIGSILSLLNNKNFTEEGFIEGLEQLKGINGSAGAPSAAAIPAQQPVVQNTPVQAQAPVQPAAPVQPMRPAAPQPVNIPAGAVNQGGFNNNIPNNNVPNVPNIPNVPNPSVPNRQNEKSGGKKSLFSFGGKKKNSEKAAKAPKAPPQSSMGMGFAIPGQNNDIVGGISQKQPVMAAPAPAPAPAPAKQPSILSKSKLITRQQQPAPDPVPQQQFRPAVQEQEAYVAPVAKMGGDDGTTQMMGGYSDEGVPKLIRNKTNETIEIDKDTFNLGKDPKELLDYVINDQRVSRRHASILCKGGSYFVVDRGSTNHTYLNGRQLTPNQEYPITSGDSIRLGPEEFTFEI